MSKAKVVLSGIFYPMAILRYFEAALKRRDDIELTTAGVYTGRTIPWKGGMVLSKRYAKAPDVVLPAACKKGVPLAMARAKLDFRPDLWIQIDAGMWLEGKIPRVQNVVVGTDPHVLDYERQRKTADKFFCMQKCYSQKGDVYLPYAYDPVWHKPETHMKRFDACLLGLHYKQRDQWVRELRKLDIKVIYELGPVFEEARSLYGQAKVGLNWSSRDDLVARVFEVMAMGLPLVTNKVPDLKDFFTPGSEFAMFHDLQGAVNWVVDLANNQHMAGEMARRGLEAVKPHTYDARVQQILEEADLA